MVQWSTQRAFIKEFKLPQRENSKVENLNEMGDFLEK